MSSVARWFRLSGRFAAGAALAAGGCFLSGCVSAPVSTSTQVSPDDDPLNGGISSADVRTVATQMCPAILALPEISGAGSVVRIKVSDFTNSSRFFIDRNLFMKRLRLELNRNAGGKVRFLNSDEAVQKERVEVLSERQEEEVRQSLKKLGAEIAASPLFSKAVGPVRIAVIPVLNTNLVNLNADSFTAMLRSEIVSASGGKIQFLLPGETKGADYLLAGQFIPESMKKEGIINLATYIEVMEARAARGQSFDLTDGTVPEPGRKDGLNVNVNAPVIPGESELVRMLRNPALRENPNVNKRLNVMLVDPATKAAVFEKMCLIDRKITENSARADLILSGDISGMHKQRSGTASDYLLIGVQLTSPESNETVWEDAYEVKRVSEAGIVYR